MTHIFDKGDRVAIFNRRYSGEPILEGHATVVCRLDTANYYRIRFDGETEIWDRFAFVPPGNEADDYLEGLRAEWQIQKAVGS